MRNIVKLIGLVINENIDNHPLIQKFKESYCDLANYNDQVYNIEDYLEELQD